MVIYDHLLLAILRTKHRTIQRIGFAQPVDKEKSAEILQPAKIAKAPISKLPISFSAAKSQ
jgi:hypothetical protein